jgi:hypothetical protein
MLRHMSRKAQSTAEYVIVLGLIVAAVVAMQTYVKRGFQGRIKEAVDYTGNQGSDVVQFTGQQYEPYYLGSTFATTREAEETEDLATGGAVTRTTKEDTARTGSQTIGATQK